VCFCSLFVFLLKGILIIYNGFIALGLFSHNSAKLLSVERFRSILCGLYFSVKCTVYYRMLRYGAKNDYVKTLRVFIILGTVVAIILHSAFPKQNPSQRGFFNKPDMGNIIRKTHFIFGVVFPGIILYTIEPLKNA